MTTRPMTKSPRAVALEALGVGQPALPAYHSFGDFWNHLFPLRYGQPLYILPRFDLADFIAAVERFCITETYLVPIAVQMLTQAGRAANNPRVRESLASLRYIGVSGAPVDAASLQRCEEVLHQDAMGCDE